MDQEDVADGYIGPTYPRREAALMNEILPGLWIGSIRSLSELSKVSNTHCRWTVVSVVHSDELVQFARAAIAHLRSNSADQVTVHQHLLWRLADQSVWPSAFLSSELQEVLAAIHEALNSGSCLVHCSFGVSRSASVCAAYLLSNYYPHEMTVSSALDHIRLSRAKIRPNSGFMTALQTLESCNGDISQAITMYPLSEGTNAPLSIQVYQLDES
jgi:protein-tyrosine phosphatase